MAGPHDDEHAAAADVRLIIGIDSMDQIENQVEARKFLDGLLPPANSLEASAPVTFPVATCAGPDRSR